MKLQNYLSYIFLFFIVTMLGIAAFHISTATGVVFYIALCVICLCASTENKFYKNKEENDDAEE